MDDYEARFDRNNWASRKRLDKGMEKNKIWLRHLEYKAIQAIEMVNSLLFRIRDKKITTSQLVLNKPQETQVSLPLKPTTIVL